VSSWEPFVIRLLWLIKMEYGDVLLLTSKRWRTKDSSWRWNCKRFTFLRRLWFHRRHWFIWSCGCWHHIPSFQFLVHTASFWYNPSHIAILNLAYEPTLVFEPHFLLQNWPGINFLWWFWFHL
jgi:hypothetical protein